MTPCNHEKLDPVGEQKTDEGVKSYLRCKQCGSLIVATQGR
jgi:ribosomal protein S26